MPECDIITVGANSVHPKRQMVFDDTKISTKNRTNLIIEKEKIICTTISNLKRDFILSQARHSHRRWLSLILTKTMRTPLNIDWNGFDLSDAKVGDKIRGIKWTSYDTVNNTGEYNHQGWGEIRSAVEEIPGRPNHS